MYKPQAFLRLLALFILILQIPSAEAQQKNTDEIDFRELPDWLDYRECVRQCFYYCLGGVCNNQVAGNLGCETNKCLCSGKSIFNLGLDASEKCAKECTTYIDEDATEARRAFTEYCVMKGHNPLGTDESPATSTTITSTTTTSTTATTSDAAPEESSNPLTTPSSTEITTATDVDPAQTTSPPTSNSSPTSTGFPTTTSTGQSNIDVDSGGKKSEFGVSEIIGTVVGIVGLFVAVLTLYITWKKRKERQHLRSLEMQAHRDIGPGYGMQPY